LSTGEFSIVDGDCVFTADHLLKQGDPVFLSSNKSIWLSEVQNAQDPTTLVQLYNVTGTAI